PPLFPYTTLFRSAVAQRKPRQEGDAQVLAGLEHVLGAAVAEVVAVLHRDDRHDFARLLELLHRDVREAHVPHLAFALELGERADLVLERHFRVGGMELVEVDPPELEALEAAFQVLAQLLRMAVLVPARRLRARKAALRADDEILRIRMHGLRDGDLAVVRSVAL